MVKRLSICWLVFTAGTVAGCNSLLGVEDHGLAPPDDRQEAGSDAPISDAPIDPSRDANDDQVPTDISADAPAVDGDGDGPRLLPDASVDALQDAPTPTDAMDSVTPDVARDGSDDSEVRDGRPDGDIGATDDATDGDVVATDNATDGDKVADAPDGGPTCNYCPVPTNGHATCDGGTCGIACDTNWTACGAECVNVGTNAQHCGRCSHDCGNGLCSQSTCQPITIQSNLDAPSGLAVDADGVYFTLADRILGCPLEGCVQAPRQLASNLPSLSNLLAANGSVAFVSQYSVYACPTTGCTPAATLLWSGSKVGSNPQVVLALGADIYAGFFGEGGVVTYRRCVAPAPSCANAIDLVSGQLRPPVAVGNGKLYMHDPGGRFSDAGASLVSYPIDQSGSITVAIPGWSATPPLLAAAGGNLYFLESDSTRRIVTCPDGACTSTTTFAPVLTELLELVADAAGVHWIQGPADAASIATCPLSGCVGGPQIVARNQPLASYLQSDGRFLYWVNRGTAIDGGPDTVPGTASIVRVAR